MEAGWARTCDGVVGADFDERTVLGGAAGEDFRSSGSGTQTFDLARVIADANSAAIARIVCNREIDDDRCGDDALAPSKIPLFNLACLELSAERFEGLLITRCEHHAGSVRVEPMEDTRLALAVAHTTHFRVAPDEGIGQSTKLPFPQRVTGIPAGLSTTT
jgi:hypothetical protein